MSTAIAFLVARLGLSQGGKVAATSTAGAAQVAAVIVDPTALNKAADEVAGLEVAITDANVTARAHNAATDRLADRIDDLTGRIDRLTDKVSTRQQG